MMDLLGGDTVLTIILLLNVFLLGGAMTAAFLHWRRHLKSGDSVPELSSPVTLPDAILGKVYEQAQADYERVLRRSAAAFGSDLNATTERLNHQVQALTNDLIRKEVDRYKLTMSKLNDDATKQFGESGAIAQKHRAEIEQALAERLKTMDEVLTTHQQELEKVLAERSAELNRDFAEVQATHAKRQSEIEADLAAKESTLAGQLKQRETELTARSVELENELTRRQQAFLTKQAELEQRLEAELGKQREAYARAIDTRLSDAVTAFLTETLGQQVDLGAQTPYLLAQLEAHKSELKQELEA